MATTQHMAAWPAARPEWPTGVQPGPQETIELRASEEIWSFEEPEGDIPAGQRRPFRVIAEEVVHLSHTDQPLTPAALVERVRGYVDELQVPVDVELVNVRWRYDRSGDTRQRVMTMLRGDHVANFKMLLGVDYLGHGKKWATIHMNIAVEPDRHPEPPAREEAPEPPAWGFPIVATLAGGLVLYGFVTESEALAGVGLLLTMAGLVGNVLWNQNTRQTARAGWEREQRERRRQWERDQERLKKERQVERLVRSFRVDDLRLFRTAMTEVFKAVVDDLQRQGGEIVHRADAMHGLFSDSVRSSAAAAAPSAERAADI